MPMARFMNGILIGQAKQFIPSTTAPSSKMSLTALGRERYPSHYSALGGQTHNYKKFPGLLIIVTAYALQGNLIKNAFLSSLSVSSQDTLHLMMCVKTGVVMPQKPLNFASIPLLITGS